MKIPSILLERLQRELPAVLPRLLSAMEEGLPVVSIRVNKFKPTPFEVKSLESIPWCEGGYWLSERPSFTLDPAFHAGAYYVQESSSMIIDHLLRQLPNYKMAIDLCAAPGGKTTILADRLSAEGVLLANEIVPKRAEILAENINKWGNSKVVVTNANPTDLAKIGSLADLILVDAPCSGEGMFRKDPEAIAHWHSDLPAACSLLQKDILASAIQLLKPGGHLIYSTCTFGKCENEDNWLWLHSRGLVPIKMEIPDSWGFIDSNGLFPEIPAGVAYRAMPGISVGEGFFVCVFQKPKADLSQSDTNHVTAVDPKIDLPISTELQTIKSGDKYHAVSALQRILLDQIDKIKNIKTVRKGGEIGYLNSSNALVPAHALALSTDVQSAFPAFHLPRTQALWYLARKEFLPQKLPVGFFKVYFDEWCLGWGSSNRQGKFINCYPAHSKIKMQLPNQRLNDGG